MKAAYWDWCFACWPLLSCSRKADPMSSHTHAHHDHDHGHHHHGHGHSHAPADFGFAFGVGITLNILFVIVGAAFGLIGHSMALIADAGHNLSDVLGLVMAWVASVLVKRAPSQRF